MKCRELIEKIDSLSERYVDLLEEICNIESPTDDKEGVDRVGLYFIEFAKKQGWTVDVCRQEFSGDAICITANPDAKKPPIAFSGHMDTVHPVGSFGTPAVRREGGRMYGPGTKDCKGGLAAALLAMDALCQCGFHERPLLLLLQSDEEVGSALSKKETIRYICKKAEGADAFLNLEGIRKNTAVLSRKGILRVRFTVYGKAAHSSECLSGANAIAEAAHKIIELEKMKDAAGLTCNCGIVSGGTAPNTVADRCEFIADIRFSNQEEKRMAYDAVRIASETVFVDGCRCETEEMSYRPPMEYTERNDALLKRMNAIYKENGLPELSIRHANGGSDAAYVTEHGIPCVDSIAVDGAFIHSLNEYADIASIAEAAKRMATVAYCL